MATWPTTLPQKFNQDNYSEEEPDLFIITDMDAGPPKIRRRFTYTSYPITGTMTMTPAQKAIFSTFYRTYGGVRFDFPDPGSSGTIYVAFSKPAPTYTPYAAKDWAVNFTLLVL